MMVEAARVIVEHCACLAPPLAQAHDIVYPTDLAHMRTT
jgi:hypothetical protein